MYFYIVFHCIFSPADRLNAKKSIQTPFSVSNYFTNIVSMTRIERRGWCQLNISNEFGR